MIDDLKAFGPGGVICTTDIHQLFVLTVSVISKEGQHWHNGVGASVKRQLVLVDLVMCSVTPKGQVDVSCGGQVNCDTQLLTLNC